MISISGIARHAGLGRTFLDRLRELRIHLDECAEELTASWLSNRELITRLKEVRPT